MGVRCINIGISRNVSRYDSIKNREGISVYVLFDESVDIFSRFVVYIDRSCREDKRNIALEIMRRIEKLIVLFSFFLF